MKRKKKKERKRVFLPQKKKKKEKKKKSFVYACFLSPAKMFCFIYVSNAVLFLLLFLETRTKEIAYKRVYSK